MKKNQCIFICVVLLLCENVSFLGARESLSGNGRLSVNGGVGISGARGDYPSEYDARVEFSFSPGLRLRLDESFAPNTFILVDVGFLKTGFVGYVAPADYYFWRTYEYVNFNTMFGSQLD